MNLDSHNNICIGVNYFHIPSGNNYLKNEKKKQEKRKIGMIAEFDLSVYASECIN